MAADQIRAFFDDYRGTFARFDASELVELFAFPLHVVSDGEEVAPITIARREDWLGVLEGLLSSYRTLDVVVGEPLDFEVAELSSRVASACVHWSLRRPDGSEIYDFVAVYTLVKAGAEWRVTAIAHDELPKLQTTLADL